MSTRFTSLEFDEDPRRRDEEPSRPSGPEKEVRDENYYIALAQRHFQTARFEHALRYYSRALEFNPNMEAAWVGQVRMLIEMGELKEAELWVNKALQVFREHADLLSAKAVIYTRLGQRDLALDFSDAATRQKSSSPYVWLARGEVLLAIQGRQGEFCLEKAKTADPRDWFMRLSIARILYFYRHYAKALSYARQAMDLEPSSPFVWLVIGHCQLALHEWRKAQEAYEQALTLDPRFDQAEAALHDVKSMGFFRRHFPVLSRIF